MTGIGTGVACSTCATPPSAVDSRVTLSSAAESSGAAAVAKVASTQVDAARYFSPRVTYDQQAGIFVVQFRNSQTGAVELQIPPDRVIREYLRIQRQRDEEAASLTGTDRGTGATAAPGVPVEVPDIQASSAGTASGGNGQNGAAAGDTGGYAAESRVTA